ncbi:MAG: hydroxylamine reductase, partial [Acidobacteria bacterium]|nr:hydroxylamine reductase [Acidobacteriota bacterium]
MFCNQCEETVKGTGCTVKGVCGKDDEIAAYQDVLIHVCKGIAIRNLAAMKHGRGDPQAGLFLSDALFSTLTNVNFDKVRFTELINRAVAIRDALPASGSPEPDACTWKPAGEGHILMKAKTVGILATENEDVRSLRSTLLFGLKGIGAYYTHAAVLGKTDDAITGFIQKALASLLQDLPVPDMVALVLECGEYGVKVLALLDDANTSAYGKPEITNVKTTVGTRPGILITGHDLKDLEMLLEQSKDAGLDIYTHGEMLPAHAYPAFKKYPHLYGNYGGSWPHQKEEFEQFNGPVLFTTNCLVPPKDTYKGRLFTTGLTGFSGVPNIEAGPGGKKDFS